MKDAIDCEYSQENQGTWAKQTMISLWFVSERRQGTDDRDSENFQEKISRTEIIKLTEKDCDAVQSQAQQKTHGEGSGNVLQGI